MSTPSCESWKALLAGYLYEDLDPSSRAAVEGHLAGCASCRETLETMRETSDALDAWTVPVRAPRRKVVTPRNPVPLVAAAAAAVLFAAVLFFATRPPTVTEAPAAPTTRRPIPRPEEPKPIPPPPRGDPIPTPPPVAPDPAPEKPVPPPPAPKAEPEPAPLPVPPPAPPKKDPPSTTTQPAPTVIAQLDWIQGPAAKHKTGAKILSGETVATSGPGSLAVVRLGDGTRLDFEADTQIVFGEKLELVHGAVTADVARQPAGRAVVFTTPHAEARVLGTRLRLAVEADATRLDVREGKVRFTRTRDGASTEVSAGSFSSTSTPRLTPRTIREVAFQDGVSPIPAYAGTRDTFLSQTSPTHLYGTKATIQVDGNNPSGTGNDLNLLLRWDLSSIPRGSRIQSVVVALRGGTPTKQPFPVYAIRRAWTEEEATWQKPWQEAGAAGALDRGAAVVGWLVSVEPDVHLLRLNAEGVALVQSWIDAPDANHGLVIPGGDISNGLQLHSRESQDAGRRPKLTVAYLPK